MSIDWPGKPSLLHNVPAAEYHADAFGEVPTASRSCLHTLLTVSPRHAASEHPRLPGEKVRKTSKEMDLGALVHALLLGGEEQIVIVEEKDFKKDHAIAKRNAAWEAGLVPICRPKYQEVAGITHRLALEILEVVSELVEAPVAWRDLGKEVTCLWEEWLPEDRIGPDGQPVSTRVRCRARFDLYLYLREISTAWIFDLKSVTKGYATVDKIDAKLNDKRSSLAMQSGFYPMGLAAVHSELAGRINFVELQVEVKPPYSVLATPVCAAHRRIGEDQANSALRQWAQHLAANDWSSPRIVESTAADWAINRELMRQATEQLNEQDEEGSDDEA